MPFTDPTPAGLGDTTAPGAEACGGTTKAGALPLDAPLVQTPGNRVGTVPHGQPSAAAGEATTTGAEANATANPKTRIPRFTATSRSYPTSPTRLEPSPMITQFGNRSGAARLRELKARSAC
jgi:hypothetical protein